MLNNFLEMSQKVLSMLKKLRSLIMMVWKQKWQQVLTKWHHRLLQQLLLSLMQQNLKKTEIRNKESNKSSGAQLIIFTHPYPQICTNKIIFISKSIGWLVLIENIFDFKYENYRQCYQFLDIFAELIWLWKYYIIWILLLGKGFWFIFFLWFHFLNKRWWDLFQKWIQMIW